MKQAIVFAGGGSKGAYQIGVWRALNELGESFDIATGTSVGSINAAFYVQHDLEAATEMWQNLDVDSVMVNGMNFEKSFGVIFEQREKILPFAKSYFKGKGADVKPFYDMVEHYYNPDKFFSSDVDFGLMTCRYPSFEPHEVYKSDMAQDKENGWHWIGASTAAFPVFPAFEINGEQYVDGGWYDNVPISMAIKLGAEKITAVDLNTDKVHMGYIRHPWVHYIKPSKDLGTFLNFEKDAISFSMNLGYDDCMKEYGRYLGEYYTFDPDYTDDTIDRAAQIFTSVLTLSEAQFEFMPMLSLHRVNKLEGCSYILAEIANTERPTEKDMFIAAIELLMGRMGYKCDQTYKLSSLLYELKSKVDRLYPLLEFDFEKAFETLKQFFEQYEPTEDIHKKKIDKEHKRIIIMSIIRTLQQCNFR